MSSGYVIPVDPAELANRFADPDSLLDECEREDAEEVEALFSGDDYETRILPLLDRIPKREADLIDLYYVCKKRQADIATIFGVTQAAISYRLDRGIQRIKFLLSIPDVLEEDMREDLKGLFEQIDINILVGMWKTTCQSEVAKELQLTQGRVRHRFFKAVDTLKREVEQAGVRDEISVYTPYHKIFSSISSKKFNILRAVQLPQWANRGVDRCL
jgi:DNA-directed RNA polymerase specialized sigma24 family protein